MPNSPGLYAFYDKITGNSVAEPSTISLFSIDQPTLQVIQTRSYTFTNYLLGEKTVKRLQSSMKFSFLRKTTPQKQILSMSDWPISLFTFFQPLYSEPHVLRKTHTTFAYQSHWLRLWSFLPMLTDYPCYAFLQTRYLKNNLRYEVDIYYTVSWPYTDMLIIFWVECTKYCQSYFPFYENSVMLSCKCNILRIIWDINLIFGIQYPDHMKMCWFTFGQSAPNIISLFMKIKCLLYLWNQFS